MVAIAVALEALWAQIGWGGLALIVIVSALAWVLGVLIAEIPSHTAGWLATGALGLLFLAVTGVLGIIAYIIACVAAMFAVLMAISKVARK